VQDGLRGADHDDDVGIGDRGVDPDGRAIPGCDRYEARILGVVNQHLAAERSRGRRNESLELVLADALTETARDEDGLP
jgi:hypothetical protein